MVWIFEVMGVSKDKVRSGGFIFMESFSEDEIVVGVDFVQVFFVEGLVVNEIVGFVDDDECEDGFGECNVSMVIVVNRGVGYERYIWWQVYFSIMESMKLKGYREFVYLQLSLQFCKSGVDEM